MNELKNEPFRTSKLSFTTNSSSASSFRVKANERGKLKLYYFYGGTFEPSYEEKLYCFLTTSDTGSFQMVLKNFTKTYKEDSDAWEQELKESTFTTFTLYYRSDASYTTVTEVADSNSTVINLFDYWVPLERTAVDSNGTGANAAACAMTGINVDKDGTAHALQFNSGNGTDLNDWTESAKVYQGILNSTLTNGYPTVSSTYSSTQESLAYLFDSHYTGAETAYRKVYTNVTGLLQTSSDGYLYYNCSENYAELNEATNSFTLYDQAAVPLNGSSTQLGQFFPFDSIEETGNLAHQQVYYGSSTTKQISPLNHHFGLTLTSRFFQQNGGFAESSKSTPVTFEFSGDDDVWIYIDGVLVADLGGIHDIASVKIDFSTGTVVINEGTQYAKYTRFEDIFAGTNVALTDVDEKAAVTRTGAKTLADDTTHTLKFFYLERGNNASNLYLKYNLTEIPVTSLVKVDQFGDKVVGATFAVYKTDNTYTNYIDATNSSVTVSRTASESEVDYTTGVITKDSVTIHPAFVGTTDEDGELYFADEYGSYYSIDDLRDLFGSNFVLREIQVPNGYHSTGYRSTMDELELFIKGGIIQSVEEERDSSGNLTKVSETYRTGAYVSVNNQLTAANTLVVYDTSHNVLANTAIGTDANGNTITTGADGTFTYYEMGDGTSESTSTINGTLFAVVVKRNGRESGATTLSELNVRDWDAMIGTTFDGYTVDTSSESEVAKAIEAAQYYEETGRNSHVFTENAVMGMQVTLVDMPENGTKYYGYWLQQAATGGTVTQDDIDGIEYGIAYYWTSASSVSGATESNTWRVNATTSSTGNFSYKMSNSIEVPNVINALYFQKTDATTGDAVNDAVFGLYAAASDDDGNGYYVGTDKDGNTVYITLGDTENTDGTVSATVYSDTGQTSLGTGTYTISVGSPTYGADGDCALSASYGSGTNVGVITVTTTDSDGNTTGTYTITPAKNANNDTLVGKAHESCTLLEVDGTGHFRYLNNGQYFLKELSAPTGYKLNYANTMVVVNNSGVYANAGTGTDGVSVGNSLGNVVPTLRTYASTGQINETLAFLQQYLAVNTTNNFSAIDDDGLVSVTGYGKSNGETWTFGSETSKNITDSENLITTTTDVWDADGRMGSALIYTETGTAALSHDYVVDDGAYFIASRVTDTDTTALWTKSGWSAIELYQNSASSSLSSATGVKYSTLTTTDGQMELSNLYSTPTVVRVEDEPDVKNYAIRVKKVKQDGETYTALEGASFSLQTTVTTTTDNGDGTTTPTETTKYWSGSTTTTTEATGVTTVTATMHTHTNDCYDEEGNLTCKITTSFEAARSTDKTVAEYVFTGLTKGSTCTLTETVVPTGYTKAADSSVTVDQSTTTTESITGDGWHLETLEMKNTDGTTVQVPTWVYTKTVINEPVKQEEEDTGYELPATGGSTPEAFQLMGAAAALAALLALACLRKREKARRH